MAFIALSSVLKECSAFFIFIYLFFLPPQAEHCAGMEKMKRIKKRLSLTLRSSQTVDESLSELAEQMTIEDGGTKDSGNQHSNSRKYHRKKRCKQL